jgi:peroxiredoxin
MAAKRIDILVLVFLLGSLSLNVYLGWKNKRLQDTVLGLQGVRLVAGTKVEPIKLTDLAGKNETITYADSNKPTVFYILSPTCGWCERNTRNIETLASLKGSDFRFIGVSLEDANLKQYVDSHNFSFPIYKSPTPESIRALGLKNTPQTIVISPDGRVLKNWIGIFAERLQPEVEAYFGVRLPGLTSANN